MTKYFTIKYKPAGLGRQLGQLDLLYKIGKSLGYEYVHTPFVCLLGHISRRVDIEDFLKLNNGELSINDSIFKNSETIEINLCELIKQQGISDIHLLKKCIEMVYPQKDIIYSFVWTEEFYSNKNLLTTMVQRYNRGNKALREKIRFRFSEGYWERRKTWPIDLAFDREKINIAVHVRRGSNACIKLNNKIIDAKNLQYINRIEEITDRPKKPFIDILKYDAVLKRIFDKYGENKFCVLLFSDGYERAFRKIVKARKSLNLSRDEVKELKKMNKECNKEFDIFRKYSNVTTFIGETEENLYKAIHAFATADIVVKGAGSFAGKYMLFRKPDDPKPLIIKMLDEETHDRTIDSIELMIKRKTLSQQRGRDHKMAEEIYIFIKIPKTAGTTFLLNFQKNYKPEEILILASYVNKDFEERNYIIKYLKSIPKSQKEKIRFITGHKAFYGIHKFIDKTPKYITFLRDPVNMAISQYNFALQNLYEGKDENIGKLVLSDSNEVLPFKEWFENSTHFHNFMTRFLSSGGKGTLNKESLKRAKEILKNCYFVGITENFNEDASLLYKKLYIIEYVNRANVSKKYFIPENYEEIRKFVLSKSKLDQQLYEYALSLNRELREKVKQE